MSRICIFGAGSVGCVIGARLVATGSDVVMIGRPRVAADVSVAGLRLTDYRGADFYVPPERLHFSTSAMAASDADVVLVTVKSAATVETAHQLQPLLKRDATVVSFQNGIGNADILRRELAPRVVLAGMVPFNATSLGPGIFHQGTEGILEVENHPCLDSVAPDFARAGLPLKRSTTIAAVLWAKLLLNLNNPVNALSGVPLRQELSQRGFRRCLALAQREALELFELAQIRPAQLTGIPPRWVPLLLGLPDVIFRRVASRMLAIDPLARSSMLDDLQMGRVTEIDWINGVIVELARAHQRPAPVNARLIELVRQAERGDRRHWSADDLLADLSFAATRANGPSPTTG